MVTPETSQVEMSPLNNGNSGNTSATSVTSDTSHPKESPLVLLMSVDIKRVENVLRAVNVVQSCRYCESAARARDISCTVVNGATAAWDDPVYCHCTTRGATADFVVTVSLAVVLHYLRFHCCFDWSSRIVAK